MHKTVNMMKAIIRFYKLAMKAVDESTGDHKITMAVILKSLSNEITMVSTMK
jgi:hypothetical protein